MITFMGFVLVSSVFAAQENNDPFEGTLFSKRVNLQSDVPHREAEAWALCTVVFELSSYFLEDDTPAQAKLLHQLANGTKLAVAMSIFLPRISSEMTPEEFNSSWSYAKHQMQNLPDLARDQADVLLERQGMEQFLTRLIASQEICLQAGEKQQMYVDTWRELAQSGLMKLPE